jgi:hypothetical protein
MAKEEPKAMRADIKMFKNVGGYDGEGFSAAGTAVSVAAEYSVAAGNFFSIDCFVISA